MVREGAYVIIGRIGLANTFSKYDGVIFDLGVPRGVLTSKVPPVTLVAALPCLDKLCRTRISASA